MINLGLEKSLGYITLQVEAKSLVMEFVRIYHIKFLPLDARSAIARYCYRKSSIRVWCPSLRLSVGI